MQKKQSMPKMASGVSEKSTSNSTKRAFTIKEAAEYACVSRGTIETWVAKGILPFEELPGTGKKQRFRRIRKKDMDELLDRSIVENPARKQPESRQKHEEVFLLRKTA